MQGGVLPSKNRKTMKYRILKREYPALDQALIREKMFFPSPLATRAPAGARDMELEADDCVIGARFYRPDGDDGANIILFHGARDTVADCDHIGSGLAATGVAVIAVDYRGYGKSSGKPSATVMIRDAHAILPQTTALLAKENRKGHVAVMGRSLGSACAIELAASYPKEIAGMIIESGFARTTTLLAALGIAPAGFNETDGFANLEKLKAITRPTMIIHGLADQLIPVAEAETMQAECGARGKELQLVPGAGHQEIEAKTGRMYFEVLGRFLAKLGKSSTRKRRPGVRS